MLMLQAMVMREVQKEHSCTKRYGWRGGEPCGCKSTMDGSRKEQQDKMPACGEAWYSTTQAQLLDLLWSNLSLSLSCICSECAVA